MYQLAGGSENLPWPFSFSMLLTQRRMSQLFLLSESQMSLKQMDVPRQYHVSSDLDP